MQTVKIDDVQPGQTIQVTEEGARPETVTYAVKTPPRSCNCTTMLSLDMLHLEVEGERNPLHFESGFMVGVVAPAA